MKENKNITPIQFPTHYPKNIDNKIKYRNKCIDEYS